MNFKDMLAKMSQLSEATKEVKGGKVHTADKGGYGRKIDAAKDEHTDDEPKKKRGGQEKDTGPKFDSPKGDIFGRTSGEVPADAKPKKKGLKEYFDSLDKALNEADQIQIKPASQMPKQPGQSSMGAKPAVPGQPQQVAGQPQKNTQVIAQGDKVLGSVDNPQLAQQIKQSIGKGEMTLMPGEAMAEGEDEGKPGKNFAKIAKSAAKEYGSKAAGERVAGAVRAKLMKQGKIKEAEIPSHDGDEGANLGAGRSAAFLEGKKAKPDFLDIDKDGNEKESFKKAVKDKKKVKESMDNRLKAAHHAGRAHGLTGQAHCGKNYEDMEEARMYHEGYKQGLDECHGQMPIQGYVGENNTEVDDMASFGAHTPAMEDEFDEGNAFTHKLATTPAGGSFKLGGKSFRDTSDYDSSVFESWDNQLNSLLEEYNTIQEGLSVSISKGQEGAPDSVSVTAQDGEADQLLQFIKQAGLGIFGGDQEQPQVGTSSPMSVATDGEPETAEIGVVGDHDGMMDLIKKVTGGEQSGPEHGFGDEEDSGEEHDHEHTDEETCNECGMMECECGDEEGQEQVDEVESEDQMEYEVAEDNAPDSGAGDTAIEVADDQEANASGAAYDAAEDEEQVEESLANGADDTFETDIAFMTKVISGGLNKQKSTGQTTIPVIAGQNDREGYSVSESVADWKTLAGIK
jgi:hypothetical protein